jgi:MYXO-CTERM domain-containing protein
MKLLTLVSLLFGGAAGVALFSLAPSVAHAGGCTPCTTSAECVEAFGDPAFCIEWTDGTAACPGSATPERGCCPGQGCATFSGRPSCETEGRCTVVDDGDTDAGIPPFDAGASDLGVGVDAGPGTDLGGGGTDLGGGSGGTSRRSGGCGCHVGGERGDSLAALAFALLAIGALARRRRSSRR